MTDNDNSRLDKHTRIINAAIKVFAKNGFYNSKVSEIAKEAEVADGTIYLYFKSKDDILISLFEESMDEIIQKINSEVEGINNPLEKLKIFINVHLNLLKDNQSLAEVIQVELRQSSKFVKEYENIKFQEYLNIISGILKEGQEKGIFEKEVMPGIFKRMLFGAIDEIATSWVLSKKKKYTIEECSNQVFKVFSKGILTR